MMCGIALRFFLAERLALAAVACQRQAGGSGWNLNFFWGGAGDGRETDSGTEDVVVKLVF